MPMSKQRVYDVVQQLQRECKQYGEVVDLTEALVESAAQLWRHLSVQATEGPPEDRIRDAELVKSGRDRDDFLKLAADAYEEAITKVPRAN